MQRSLRAAPLSLLLSLFAAACSSSSGGNGSTDPGGDDVTAICTKLVQCGVTNNGAPLTQSDCLSTFQGWVPPSGCRGFVDSATCAQVVGNDTTAFVAACTPTCTGTNTECSNDSSEITTCSNGTTFTFTCASVCQRESKTYTGTCAASFNGQTSSNGQPVCWCQ